MSGILSTSEHVLSNNYNTQDDYLNQEIDFDEDV